MNEQPLEKPEQPLPASVTAPQASGLLSRLKKSFPTLAIGLLVIGKLLAKLKFLVLPLLKILPLLLKTGGSMFFTIWIYAMNWGWPYAVGFVLLLLVHELGHLLAARQAGLKVGTPMFIPFMGAFIALKENPSNAWVEAWVALGGPLLGSLGALGCVGLYLMTGYPLLLALAYSGFFLNLFNLAPLGILDGGRIAGAISPWLWAVGLVVVAVMLLHHFNFLLLVILVTSLPRLKILFRGKTAQEARYFEVTPAQRGWVAFLYFGLALLLVVGMSMTHIRMR